MTRFQKWLRFQLKDYKVNPVKHKYINFCMIAFCVSIVLEIFLFNYQCFAMLGGKYEKEKISIESGSFDGFNKINDTTYEATSSDPSIEFNNINKELRFIYLNMESTIGDNVLLNVDIEYTDATQSDFRRSPNSMQIVRGIEDSYSRSCTYFGATEKLRFLPDIQIGEQIIIHELILNNPVPMRFKFLRVMLVFLLMAAVYFSFKTASYCKAYHSKIKAHRNSVILVCILFITLTSSIFYLYVPVDRGTVFQSLFQNTTGDQVSKELVDMMKNGKVDLGTPDHEFYDKENGNPYDIRQRSITLKEWDHVYLNGKFYSYYGIAPVFTLLLPYHLLTGYYLHSGIATYIFCILSIIFLCLAYFTAIKNWFAKTPLNMVILGQVMLLFGSGVLLLIGRPLFYELVSASALFFFSVCLYFLLKSNIFTQGKVRISYIALSAAGLSLAILSRPTYVLYVFPMLVWLWFGLKKNKESMGKFILAAMIPFVFFGGIQMIYNYLRFDSVFEFGIQYSLTINDFRETEYRPFLSFLSIANTLFATQNVTPHFPFVTGNLDTYYLNGYYYWDWMIGSGSFWRVLPFFSFLYIPKVIRDFPLKKALKLSALILLPGLLIPLIIIGITWESGNSPRYTADFMPIMTLAAFAIIFYVYNKMRQSHLKKVLTTIFAFCALWAVISNLAFCFQRAPECNESTYGNEWRKQNYYEIEEMFEFWK